MMAYAKYIYLVCVGVTIYLIWRDGFQWLDLWPIGVSVAFSAVVGARFGAQRENEIFDFLIAFAKEKGFPKSTVQDMHPRFKALLAKNGGDLEKTKQQFKGFWQ